MSTTPNYNWPLIEPTDFVTNLPADLETLADAIDASFAAGEGDLLVGGSSNIFEALPIGANGTVLSSDGTTAAWATPSAPFDQYTLLNTGGTALTGGGASTRTISFSAQNSLYIYVAGASMTGVDQLQFQLNSDSGSNYIETGIRWRVGSAAPTVHSGTVTEVRLANPTAQANLMSAQIFIQGANGTGVKPYQSFGMFNGADSATAWNYLNFGNYFGTSPITSISIISNSSAFDAGTVFVYGA
jgi:hypothetical protein